MAINVDRVKTTDVCDDYDEDVLVAEPMFKHYGKRHAFAGRIATVKVHEDNVLVRDALERQGNGKVLVVDGGASMRCALVGDQIAALAQQNQWTGIVIYGCVRDVSTLISIDIGILALGPHPRRSAKNGAGQRDVSVTFAGVTFTTGDHIYADEDGLIIAPSGSSAFPSQ